MRARVQFLKKDLGCGLWDGGREVIGFWTCLESRAAVSLDRVTVSLPRISMSLCKWFSDKKESCSYRKSSNPDRG